MKLEVLFVGSSIDSETYEAESVTWAFGEGLLVIFAGDSPDNPSASSRGVTKVATYPMGRVVRVRIIA